MASGTAHSVLLSGGKGSITNTPPATGSITVPQSPAGTSTTNTGRSTTGTQTLLASFKIS